MSALSQTSDCHRQSLATLSLGPAPHGATQNSLLLWIALNRPARPRPRPCTGMAHRQFVKCQHSQPTGLGIARREAGLRIIGSSSLLESNPAPAARHGTSRSHGNLLCSAITRSRRRVDPAWCTTLLVMDPAMARRPELNLGEALFVPVGVSRRSFLSNVESASRLGTRRAGKSVLA